MICSCCKIDKLITDFINNNNICYKCVYQKKLEKTPKKRTRKQIVCRICGDMVSHQEEVKKRQRTVFCSQECAKKGHQEKTSNYWTRTIRSGRVHNSSSIYRQL